jgi:hypothetical protein
MAKSLPVAEIVHAMPGRARLRIAERRGDAVFFASVATGLSTIAGVRKAEVRPLTASVLIQHGPPLERIMAAAQEARLFRLADPGTAPPPTEAFKIDPKMVVGLGLGGLAIWQLTEGKILPPAITLAWYAASLAGFLSDHDVADGHE